MKHEVSHVARDCSELIAFLLNEALVSDGEKVILVLLLCVEPLSAPHSILLFLFFRPEIAELSQDGDQLILAHLRVLLNG